MASILHGLEFLDAHVGVDGGGFELGVSEELLDVADVRAAFEHVRGAGVAKQVRAAGSADVGLLDVVGALAAEDFWIEELAVAGEKERGFVGFLGQERPDFVEVAGDPVEGAVSHGGDTVFAALPFADAEDLLFGVEVGEFEAGEFGAAQAGGVEEFQHGDGS